MRHISKILALIFCATLSAVGQVEPLAGGWRTWIVPSVKDLRVPPPPGAGDTLAELDQLRAAQSQADAAAMANVTYWNAGSPAYRWMQLATQEVLKRNPPGVFATRAMALIAAAINDATIAAWDSKYAYMRDRPSRVDQTFAPSIANPNSPSYPSDYAATAAAAAAVMSYLWPDSTGQYTSLAQQAAQSRVVAGVEFQSDSKAGWELGVKVGQAAVAYGQADGSDVQFQNSYPPTPGKWSGTNPVTPLAGTWKAWALSANNQLRPPAPPAPDSQQFLDQVALVKNLNRTVDISRTAWIWQQGFIAPWIDTINQKISEYHLDNDPPGAAVVYALTMLAQQDAGIACWDAKYVYLEMRPFMADSTITTLFPTPNHPSFPSGHACASGGVASVLSTLFPADAQFFMDRATQAGTSTFYSGVHYPLDVDTGLAIGQAAGAAVVSKQSATQ